MSPPWADASTAVRDRERRRAGRAGHAYAREPAKRRPTRRLPLLAPAGARACPRQGRRRTRLLRLEPPRQLRVGARLHEALRPRACRLRDAAPYAQAQREVVRRARRQLAKKPATAVTICC